MTCNASAQQNGQISQDTARLLRWCAEPLSAAPLQCPTPQLLTHDRCIFTTPAFQDQAAQSAAAVESQQDMLLCGICICICGQKPKTSG